MPLVCHYHECNSAPAGTKEYCKLHLRILNEKGLKIIAQLYGQIRHSWGKFIDELKKKALPEDPN